MRHAIPSSDLNADWLPYNGPTIIQSYGWFEFTLNSYLPATIIVVYSKN